MCSLFCCVRTQNQPVLFIAINQPPTSNKSKSFSIRVTYNTHNNKDLLIFAVDPLGRQGGFSEFSYLARKQHDCRQPLPPVPQNASHSVTFHFASHPENLPVKSDPFDGGQLSFKTVVVRPPNRRKQVR